MSEFKFKEEVVKGVIKLFRKVEYYILNENLDILKKDENFLLDIGKKLKVDLL